MVDRHSSSLPSTGRILLVNNIFWHLPPLGKIRPQLLYRTSGEQLAHGAGAQRLLHPSRPKWHTIGRQWRHYQRMYLGILGKEEWCQSGKQELGRKRRTEVGGETYGPKTRMWDWARFCPGADQLQAFIPHPHRSLQASKPGLAREGRKASGIVSGFLNALLF